MSADSMNSVFGFIGILAVGCGIYCLYAYFNMKKDGHINYGIVDCIHWYVNPMEMVDTVGGILFMAALVVFAVYTMQLKKKYF